MKKAVENKYISLEDVEAQLYDLRNLLCLHSDYFAWSKEKVKEEPHYLTCRYEQQGSLVSAMIDVLDNTQELLTIAQENYTQKPYT